MMEQAVTDYVGATILALTPHFTPVASWADPGMPAAAIVLDGYRRQITWTPDSGWRYTRLHTGTAAQRGPAYYLDAGPVPAPQMVVDRLRRWQSGGESWSLTQPSYPPGGVLEALRAAVPDPSAQRSCPDCGQWTAVDPADRDVCCETCGTRLLDAQAALDERDADEIKRLRAELATVRDKKALARAYAEVQGFAQRETARAERLAEQVRVLAGVLKRGRPEVHCTKHPDQPDSDCETCRDVETFRAALDGTEADRG